MKRLAAFALGLAVLLPGSGSVAANRVHGAVVDDTAKRVGEDRFKSSEDWEKTVKFFRSAYGGKPGIIFRMIPTPPKVKAMHIQNTSAKRTWDGINIYETGGDVFIYVLRAEG